jgi:RNA polymerase sigma factor (sigma-70 family)
METLSEILEKGAQVGLEQELKPLTAAIARNKATDRLRRHLAEKRGGNKTQSLEELVAANAGELPDVPLDEFVDHRAIQELRVLLAELSTEVKKEYRVVLRDHYFDQLSYNEIAAKRKISIGSVGVYVQRGLVNLRNVIARRPKLQNEFLAMLSDASVVKVLLPLVSAVQIGGWFASHAVQASVRFSIRRPENCEEDLSDEERLKMIGEELPQAQTLDEPSRTKLQEKLKVKYPARFPRWQQEQELLVRREAAASRRYKRAIFRNRAIALLVLAATLYGLIRFVLWLF